VGHFDWGIVEEAVWANSPTQIALHGADYLDFRNKAVDRYDDLTPSARAFVEDVEGHTSIPVSFIGTGPTNEEIIDRRLKGEVVGTVSTSHPAALAVSP
jgi:adenylosuccinate synthase